MSTALERLRQADELDDLGNKMAKKKDPANAARAHKLASNKRSAALKSMSRRRKAARNVIRW